MKHIRKIVFLAITFGIFLFGFYTSNVSAESSEESSASNYSEVFSKPKSELTKEELKIEEEFQKAIADAPVIPFSSYTPRAGDILYTPSTQCVGDSNVCKGITGHVGIAVGPTVIYHIAGKNDTPGPIGINTWRSRYSKTIVVRPDNWVTGGIAGAWVEQYYGPSGDGAKKTYSVISNRSLSSSTVYCSLIPYHGYLHGVGISTVAPLVFPIPPVHFVNAASRNNMHIHARIGY